jgi:hypothetical protein
MNFSLLAAIASWSEPHFPILAVSLLVIGFMVAAIVGSIAWYNSKRPPGWEGKERPDIVPKVDKEDSPGVGEPGA